jgi:RND family efflux transporter MFP subunit
MKPVIALGRAAVWVARLAAPLVLIAAGVAFTYWLITNKPRVERRTQEVKAAFVETVSAQPGEHRAVVTAFGTVEPARSVTVQTQVNGVVTRQHAHLIAGGLIREGEPLLQLDEREFELAVDDAEAAVTRAEFEVKVEMGRQVIAQREWELLDQTIRTDELGRELALRKPHLQEKQAAVAAAQARVQRAKLDLERAAVMAPMNAVVIDESVEVGQFVRAQNPVATLAGTDAFELRVSVPLDELRWVRFPRGEGVSDFGISDFRFDEGSRHSQIGNHEIENRKSLGSSVTVIQELGDGARVERTGRVVRRLGELDPAGRMARVVVAVDDPLALDAYKGEAALLLNAYVRVQIEGPVMDDVYELPRAALREQGRVWVMGADDRLQYRPVKVVLGRAETVIVRGELRPGDRVVTTNLATAVEGMLLRAAERR